jgi:hypothetical protein
MMYTYSEELFSDFHKDTYGFRPRGYHEFWDATPTRKQEIWDDVEQDFLQEMVREESAKAEALVQFEREVAQTISYGAGDRATALRWMTQNEEFYNNQDVEHWVWNRGILFTDEGRTLVKELMNTVTFEEWKAA